MEMKVNAQAMRDMRENSNDTAEAEVEEEKAAEIKASAIAQAILHALHVTGEQVMDAIAIDNNLSGIEKLLVVDHQTHDMQHSSSRVRGLAHRLGRKEGKLKLK